MRHPFEEGTLSNLADPRNFDFRISLPLVSGLGVIGSTLEAWKCLKVIARLVNECNCTTLAKAWSFVLGLDEVTIAGTLVHLGILIGLCWGLVLLGKIALQKHD
jgi:hypothetical protein